MEADIHHSNGITKNIIFGDLELNFQGQTILTLISPKLRASGKMRILTFTDVSIRQRKAWLRMLFSLNLT